MSAAVSEMMRRRALILEDHMDMSSELVFVIGIAASVIVWALRFLSGRGISISSAWLTAGVYVVAGLLTWMFAPVVLPPFPAWGGDLAAFVPALMNWFAELMVPLSASVGAATMIYNALLKRVLESLAEKIL